MLNVLIRNRVDSVDFYTTKEEIAKIYMTKDEIVEALEKAGVNEFNGKNFDGQYYQTMPGWVHINLHYDTLTEVLMKGLLKKKKK